MSIVVGTYFGIRIPQNEFLSKFMDIDEGNTVYNFEGRTLPLHEVGSLLNSIRDYLGLKSILRVDPECGRTTPDDSRDDFLLVPYLPGETEPRVGSTQIRSELIHVTSDFDLGQAMFYLLQHHTPDRVDGPDPYMKVCTGLAKYGFINFQFKICSVVMRLPSR